jgi:hypothetical protein
MSAKHMATYGILGKSCRISPESSQRLLTMDACFCVVALVNGQWSMVIGQWSMVNGQWSMVNGQWSMVIGQCTDTARVTPPPCIALAVLLSVRKLLADRKMRHAKKSVRHPATSR